MKTTVKFWIDHELSVRHSVNGWPDVPPVHASIYADTFAMQAYEKDLEKAKADSIPVEMPEGSKPGHLQANSFIELEGSVEMVDQWFNYNSIWVDLKPGHIGTPTRQIARFIPAREDGAMSFTEAAGIPGTIVPVNPHVAIGWTQAAPTEQPRTCEPFTFGEEMEQLRRCCQDFQRENADLRARLEKWDAKMRSMESSTLDLDKKISGLHKKFLVKSLDNVEELSAKLEKAEALLEQEAAKCMKYQHIIENIPTKDTIIRLFKRKADNPNSLCAADILLDVLNELNIK
jgi:hypothetical protein